MDCVYPTLSTRTKRFAGRSRQEEATRFYFEYLFKRSFESINGKFELWLVNEKGNPIEIDGYNEELKIAFEYNGPTHYKVVFDEPKLETVQRNDALKVKLCEERGITLFVIPNIKLTDLPDWITLECNARLGTSFEVPPEFVDPINTEQYENGLATVRKMGEDIIRKRKKFRKRFFMNSGPLRMEQYDMKFVKHQIRVERYIQKHIIQQDIPSEPLDSQTFSYTLGKLLD